jgi:hypothetical protein
MEQSRSENPRDATIPAADKEKRRVSERRTEAARIGVHDTHGA